MTLFEHLSAFKRPNSETELTEIFKNLAPHFIYGGYINVHDIYNIYIRTVEFYFHDERDTPDAIKDPIVYHRNRDGKEVPYFPLMTLNAHVSGFDITFENKDEKYRASALIREYSIFDCTTGKFLLLKGNKRDNRVTYLYDYLNGFPINGKTGIVWVDDVQALQAPLIQEKRYNVYAYRNEEKLKEPDQRLWSFKMREEQK